MPSCTFIGHKDTPKEIEPILESTLSALITNENVTEFFVGTQGNFDFLAQKVLRNLKQEFPNINYTIVLAYLSENHNHDYRFTLFPDELENTPRRFAIDRRNKWMVKTCDYLVCFVRHNFSNAHKYKDYAENKNKKIINLH
ncbi:MAG: hypothetical protein IKK71_02305 [Clostridia bacterium]|nr:hypothetical protein [Clostridia bacterium]